jgi:serine/threonine-protein kinase SRPK3
MFVVSALLRCAQRKRPHRTFFPSPLLWCSAAGFTFMSTSAAANVKKRFEEELVTSVRINDKDDGETFMCDEEPHMIPPELGHGYYPITLGQQLGEGKLEIVRKLGWASSSSVWLARTLG